MREQALTSYWRNALQAGIVRPFGEAEAKAALPPRPFNAHKGDCGKGLLLAGSPQYPGAALLAGQSALAVGCGVLTALSTESARPYFARLPEAVFRSVGESWQRNALPLLEETLPGKSALALGCGWGTDPDPAGSTFSALLEAAFSSGLPAIADADGLNHMARRRELLKKLHGRIILTPHPGEAARLARRTTGEILQDPLTMARAMAEDWGCVVLLKGTVTVIAGPEGTYLTAEGNGGLAKGGSGDTLTGLILAMLCQGRSPTEGACLGSWLLGVSAEKAFALLKERMLRASDLAAALETME